jgi:hypothetical protein
MLEVTRDAVTALCFESLLNWPSTRDEAEQSLQNWDWAGVIYDVVRRGLVPATTTAERRAIDLELDPKVPKRKIF